jgi:tetratricopeptide (TPR) repeat protein
MRSMSHRLLLLLVMVLSGAAHAEWHEASSDHFLVYADSPPEWMEKFANDLERFDQAVRVLRGMSDQPVGKANRVTVYVLETMAHVEELSDRDVAGLYIPRASGSVAFMPRRAGPDRIQTRRIIPIPFSEYRRTVLFHEYTHHLMRSNYAHAAFPPWMVEGWAEYHATARILDDGAVQFGAAPTYRAVGLLSGNPLPLDRILAADTAHLSALQREALYGRGWALTHYLTHEPARNAQFAQYVAAINQGKTPEEAASVFGDLNALHRELDRYIKGSRIPGVTVLASALDPGRISIRELTRGEAETMGARIQSKHGVDEKTAPRVYAEAKKEARPFPNDPGAQIVLAEAAYDAGDYSESEAAADRALAVDSNAIDALAYKAMSRMAVAKVGGDKSAETWGAIRKIIASANRLDPDDPQPLILYFRSFVDSGDAPTELAKQGLDRALDLAPQDDELRITVAQVYLADDKQDVARSLLAPLAYDPHSGAFGQKAAELIATIDGSRSTAAAAEASEDQGTGASGQ